LLSFGADEGGEEEEPVSFKKKPIVRPDLLEPVQPIGIPDLNAPPVKEKKSKQAKGHSEESKTPEASSKPSKKEDIEITKIREKHAQEKAAEKTARQTEIEKMEADIRKLARRAAGEDSDEERARKKQKRSYLEEEMAKYTKGRGVHKKGKRKDEGDVLAALNSFRSKINRTAPEEGDSGEADVSHVDGEAGVSEGAAAVGTGEEEGMEVDDDVGFLGHKLSFPKGNEEEVAKAERDYEVIDPRQRGARAKEEERERKRAMKPKDGRRGYRR